MFCISSVARDIKMQMFCFTSSVARGIKKERAEAEKGVLKLVHPGGVVELHRKPLYAYQVLRKNPRHCVTRPDFFTFPWIVVRPDSLLKLDTVFFIVPHHTIYRLLQCYEFRCGSLPPDLPHHGQIINPRSEMVRKDCNFGYGGMGSSMTTLIEHLEELESKDFGEVKLKSCLTNGKDRSLEPNHGRKVTFSLPDGDDDEYGDDE